MSIESVLESIADKSNANVSGGYMKDGLLICDKCNTPKQCRVNIPGIGEKIVGCVCKCEEQRLNEEQAQWKAEQRQKEIQRLRVNGIQDRAVRECTFANAKPTPMIDRAKRYADKWKLVREENIGLLLWGNTGNGKTYVAACIANELIDRGIPALVTSFTKLLNVITGMYAEDRIEYIRSLDEFELLVIDDLGAERQSEFALEQVYTVIDQRYKAKKPIIITTNISVSELKNAPNMDYQRIYDRVLEMCVPLHFSEGSMRTELANEKLKKVKMILGKGNEDEK